MKRRIIWFSGVIGDVTYRLLTISLYDNRIPSFFWFEPSVQICKVPYMKIQRFCELPHLVFWVSDRISSNIMSAFQIPTSKTCRVFFDILQMYII